MQAELRKYVHTLQNRWQVFAGRHPLAARLLRLGLGAGGFVLFLFLCVLSYMLLTTPSVRTLQEVEHEAASEIYAADGVLLGRYYRQNRNIVPFEAIPGHVIEALVAIEDQRFFQHSGIDYRSWARVLYRTILQGDETGGGGSTITQQLAKNLFPRQDYPVLSLPLNKLREIVTARRLERAYSKEEILGLYLNTVPFSENVFGIDVASRRFFGKSPSELSVAEGATLVGTLQATTYYNPAKFPGRAEQRRNVVLGQMVRSGYLTQVEGDSLSGQPLMLCYEPGVDNSGLAPYFLAFVRSELSDILSRYQKPNGEAYDLFRDGLKVYTTLNVGLQQMAEDAVKVHMAELQRIFDQEWRGRQPWGDDESVIRKMVESSPRYNALKKRGLSEAEIAEVFGQKIPMTIFSWDGDQTVEMSPLDSVRYYFSLLQVGFIAMEPRTGYIRAWVGGNDFDYWQYDHVRARRQVGSVFKPVVYAQALREGVEPCKQIPNRILTYHEYDEGEWAIKDPRCEDPTPHITPDGKDEDDWMPRNSDGRYGGSYSLEGALTNSVNTVTVDLIMRMGVQPVIDLARELGVTSEIPAEPSIALGSADISLYEMATVFSVFASRGQRVKPVAISRIETSDGQVIASFGQESGEQVLTEELADMMTRMLQSVTTSGTAARLRYRYGLYNLPIAGKTGTSQNHADGWFIGYTPALMAGVWVGGDSPLVRFRSFEYGQGAATALPVWAYFMKNVLSDPTYADWKNSSFPELSPELSRQLGCPHRIPSPEELLADSLAQDSLLRLLPPVTIPAEVVPGPAGQTETLQ